MQESELHIAAKKAREEAGLTQAEAAKRLNVQQPTLAQAENNPTRKLTKLRIRMIEEFSGGKVNVQGPLYRIVERES